MTKVCYTAQEFKEYFWTPFGTLCKDKQFKKMQYSWWKEINDRLKNPQTKVTIEFSKNYPNAMLIGNLLHTWGHNDGSFGSFLNRYNPELMILDSIAAEKVIPNVVSNSNHVIDEVCELKVNGTNVAIENIVNERKEEKNMFGNFDFGPVDSNVRMSAYGLAIKNSSGTWVSYDAANKCIMDVDILNFEGGNKFIYKIPAAIKDIAVGDTIVHNRRPMFVVAVRSDGKLACVDPYEGEEKVVMLAKSMFGFEFVTKVVCLITLQGASADQPFGNLLPLMLLSGDNKDIDPMLMLALTGGLGNMTQNPLLLYALMGNDSKSKDILPLLLLSGSFAQAPFLQNGNSGPCAGNS